MLRRAVMCSYKQKLSRRNLLSIARSPHMHDIILLHIFYIDQISVLILNSMTSAYASRRILLSLAQPIPPYKYRNIFSTHHFLQNCFSLKTPLSLRMRVEQEVSCNTSKPHIEPWLFERVQGDARISLVWVRPSWLSLAPPLRAVALELPS